MQKGYAPLFDETIYTEDLTLPHENFLSLRYGGKIAVRQLTERNLMLQYRVVASWRVSDIPECKEVLR